MSDGTWFFQKAAATAKVFAQEAVHGTAALVSKVAETDVQATARRLTNKVMEKADSNFKNCETVAEVESAMKTLKLTDALYKDLLAVLRESFIIQARASTPQLRAANKAEVIGRDLEQEPVRTALCSFGNHLTVTAEKNQGLHKLKEAADVEMRARDDFHTLSFDSPASRLVLALESFVNGELARAMAVRTQYKDTRREASLHKNKAEDLKAKGHIDKAKTAEASFEAAKPKLDESREELITAFAMVEQRKAELQAVFHAYLQAQLQYHKECLASTDAALEAFNAGKVTPSG